MKGIMCEDRIFSGYLLLHQPDFVWLQALEELGLDAVDLVGEEPSLFESTSQEHSEYNCYIVVVTWRN